jgi:hypothetical protein
MDARTSPCKHNAGDSAACLSLHHLNGHGGVSLLRPSAAEAEQHQTACTAPYATLHICSECVH